MTRDDALAAKEGPTCLWCERPVDWGKTFCSASCEALLHRRSMVAEEAWAENQAKPKRATRYTDLEGDEPWQPKDKTSQRARRSGR